MVSSPSQAPPSRAGVSVRVAERILDRIASGEWGIGHRLPSERQLAEDMGVSRVSVRAALQSLKARGFVAAIQGGVTRVISDAGTRETGLAELLLASGSNIRDLAEILIPLEVWGAERAARAATPANISELAAILTTEAVGTGGRDADVRFHMAVAKASGSAVYLHLMTMLQSVLGTMLARHRHIHAHDGAAGKGHRAIFSAIRGGDPVLAGDAMRAHLNGVLDAYRNTNPGAGTEADE